MWVVLDGEGLVFATDGTDPVRSRPAEPRRHAVGRVPRHAGRRLVGGSTVDPREPHPLHGRGRPDRRARHRCGRSRRALPLVERWFEEVGFDAASGSAGGAAATGDGGDRRLAARIALAGSEVDRLDAELAVEGELVDASEHAADRANEVALDQLGSVLDRKASRRVGAVGHDELLAVCREVGRSIGVTVHPAHPEDMLRASPIDAIALSSKVRSRPVRLADGWWKEPGDSFVGYRTDGQPVAVLVRRRGTTSSTPRAATGCASTRRRRESLRDDAVELVRPLPEGPLTIRTLLRFAGRGTGLDAVRLVIFALVIGFVALIPPLATSLVFGSIVPQRQTERLAALAAALVGLAFGSVLLPARSRHRAPPRPHDDGPRAAARAVGPLAPPPRAVLPPLPGGRPHRAFDGGRQRPRLCDRHRHHHPARRHLRAVQPGGDDRDRRRGSRRSASSSPRPARPCSSGSRGPTEVRWPSC